MFQRRTSFVSPEREDIRLTAFFSTLSGNHSLPVWYLGVLPMREKYGTVKAALALPDRAGADAGTPSFFIRTRWHDERRVTITCGSRRGRRQTWVWKASFNERDEVLDIELDRMYRDNWRDRCKDAWKGWVAHLRGTPE